MFGEPEQDSSFTSLVFSCFVLLSSRKKNGTTLCKRDTFKAWIIIALPFWSFWSGTGSELLPGARKNISRPRWRGWGGQCRLKLFEKKLVLVTVTAEAPSTNLDIWSVVRTSGSPKLVSNVWLFRTFEKGFDGLNLRSLPRSSWSRKVCSKLSDSVWKLWTNRKSFIMMETSGSD